MDTKLLCVNGQYRELDHVRRRSLLVSTGHKSKEVRRWARDGTWVGVCYVGFSGGLRAR
ncbi:hypothetical protein LZ30DRAFT_728450 [Colletotrichum cereale]|nr:hypothetical protein LZ30DRAFT_728450 [Colletotrichum cereale]